VTAIHATAPFFDPPLHALTQLAQRFPAASLHLYLANRTQVDGQLLIQLAERHLEWAMPGYTHLQRAQPVYLGHHLLAYFWMLARDVLRHRVELLALGLAAAPDRLMQFVLADEAFAALDEIAQDIEDLRLDRMHGAGAPELKALIIRNSDNDDILDLFVP
jgi:hypothetical protein